MAMVCPKCHSTYDKQLECPHCSIFNAPAQNSPVDAQAKSGWQQHPMGKVVIGILVAQGMAHGLQLIFDASFQGVNQEQSTVIWTTLLGLALVQGLQAVGLVIAGALAGAGQARGFLLGGIVGLANSLILLAIQLADGRNNNEVLIIGQPILHVFAGALGGLIGTAIWKPLPAIHLAKPLKLADKKKRAKTAGLFAGPIKWPRVIIGAVIAAGGTVSAQMILNFVLRQSQGEVQITSQLQSQLLVWEIAGLAVLLGSGFSGINTFNGMKQGLCVGIASGLLVGWYHLRDPECQLETAFFIGLFVFGVALVGGWFGSCLFPPVVSSRRRLMSIR